jgi:hypothetical protein
MTAASVSVLAFTEMSPARRERLEFSIVDALLKPLGHLVTQPPVIVARRRV